MSGVNPKDRMDYVNKVIVPAEGGGDSPTAKWVKGDNPFGSHGGRDARGHRGNAVRLPEHPGLAFTALMAFIGALLLLVVGVFFACLWIIPGRPRQWGLNWFEALIGLVLQSFLAMLVFGTALTLVTAVFTLTGSLGWLPVTGLAIARPDRRFPASAFVGQFDDDDASRGRERHVVVGLRGVVR